MEQQNGSDHSKAAGHAAELGTNQGRMQDVFDSDGDPPAATSQDTLI